MSRAQPLYCKTSEWGCERGNDVCFPAPLRLHEVKRVFIRLSGSADAALLHPAAFRHKRTIYLSDLTLASERTSHSENRDLYQMHVDKERRGEKKRKGPALAHTSISANRSGKGGRKGSFSD